jgi:hypothetical protein
MLLVFAATSVECAPKKSRRVRNGSTTSTVSSVHPTPTEIISLDGLAIAPAAASIPLREERTLKCFFTCAMCKKKLDMHRNEVFTCSGCENPYYCSKKCQNLNWKSHRVSLCSLISTGGVQTNYSRPRARYKTPWKQPSS